MAGDIHWLKQIPVLDICWDNNHVVVSKDIFDRIGDYTRSQPTGAKPGRIYRKNLQWTSEFSDEALKRNGLQRKPPNWFIYICDLELDDDGMVVHRGRPAIIAEHANLSYLTLDDRVEQITSRFRESDR